MTIRTRQASESSLTCERIIRFSCFYKPRILKSLILIGKLQTNLQSFPSAHSEAENFVYRQWKLGSIRIASNITCYHIYMRLFHAPKSLPIWGEITGQPTFDSLPFERKRLSDHFEKKIRSILTIAFFWLRTLYILLNVLILSPRVFAAILRPSFTHCLIVQ